MQRPPSLACDLLLGLAGQWFGRILVAAMVAFALRMRLLGRMDHRRTRVLELPLAAPAII